MRATRGAAYLAALLWLIVAVAAIAAALGDSATVNAVIGCSIPGAVFTWWAWDLRRDDREARSGVHMVAFRPCDRCDKKTRADELRPWGELQLRCCPDCDRQLADMLFPDPTAADYDPDKHQGFLHAYHKASQTAGRCSRSR